MNLQNKLNNSLLRYSLDENFFLETHDEWDIIHIKNTDSTNHTLKNFLSSIIGFHNGNTSINKNISNNENILFNIAESLNHKIKYSKTALIADTQSFGKGRLQRNWNSRKGGMWVSFSLAFEKYISGLTLGMGLALHRAVDNLLPGLDLKLKWPNDMITQENKKVAGILCESIIMGDKDPLFVIGTGLNITNRIDSSISGKACSLKEICSFKKIHTSFFAKQNLPLLFLKEYLKETDIICKSLSKIGFKSIKKEYNSISAVKNRKIFILNPDKKCIIGNGIAKDVTDTGEIKVYLENGKTALFCSGEVTFQKDFNMVK